MREQLIHYIDLLFAGAKDAGDIKQEILQNTLDRYDDLIAQGKSPESAYSLAISGIGDINEILTGPAPQETREKTSQRKNALRDVRLSNAAAFMFFILCPIPVILLENAIGVCLLLAMVAAGVGLLVFFGRETPENKEPDPRSPLHRILHGIIWGGGLALYFWLSFSTGGWYITWLIFPIIGCLCRLVTAVFLLNKTFLNALVQILIFGLLAIILSVLLLGLQFSMLLFDGTLEESISGIIQDHSTVLSGSGTADAKTVENIQIQWVNGSITVVPGDVETVVFSETGAFNEKDRMVWKQNGNTLTIRFSDNSRNLLGINLTFSKDLTVIVPRDWVGKELEIESVSANVQVHDLLIGKLELVNVSGDCELTGCSLTEFSAETVSGDVRYEGALQELDFDTVSATCTAILTAVPRKIDMNAVSGDLDVTLPENAGFTLDMDSLSGRFQSNFATTESGNRKICGDGSCKISAESVSGDIRIQKP